MGLLLIQTGQLRALILSEGGKEITLYRLYELDICLFSAACIMRNIQFDIQIEVEQIPMRSSFRLYYMTACPENRRLWQTIQMN